MARGAIQAIIVCVAQACLAGTDDAPRYPSKPLRIIVPGSSGDAPDNAARSHAAALGTGLGQQIVVENRPGASHIIAYQLLARAAPDGYTMGYVTNALATNPGLHAKLPYDSDRDFRPVILTGLSPTLLVVTPTLPVRSVKDLLEHLRAKPGAVSYGTPGVGSSGHLAMELFKASTATHMMHVPYKSSQRAISELIAGEIQVACAAVGVLLPHVRAGRLHALGVSSLRRLAAIPDIPTLDAAGIPGYEMMTWGGYAVPAKVPDAIVHRLNAELNKAVLTTANLKRAAAQGSIVGGGTPDHFAEYIHRETEKWTGVIHAAGVKLE